MEKFCGEATASLGILTVCFSAKFAESHSTASPGARKTHRRLFCAGNESVRERTGTTNKISLRMIFGFERQTDCKSWTGCGHSLACIPLRTFLCVQWTLHLDEHKP